MSELSINVQHASAGAQQAYIDELAQSGDARLEAYAKLMQRVAPLISEWVDETAAAGGICVNDILSIAASVSASLSFTIIANATSQEDWPSASGIVIYRFSENLRAGGG